MHGSDMTCTLWTSGKDRADTRQDWEWQCGGGSGGRVWFAIKCTPY